MKRDERFRAAYDFLVDKENHGLPFNMDQLAKACGWKPSTARTYVAKKIGGFLEKTNTGLVVRGVSQLTQEQFSRVMSQKQAVSSNPLRPDLSEEVHALATKAREAAILAVDVYKRTGIHFRTECFTVLMIIAWRSLFHAYFERDQTCYFYVGEDGKPMLRDGQEQAWDLSKCVNEYFKSITNAVRKNLEFMIGLRNRIEHRYVPSLDPHVAGECQALLLNFEDFLEEQFGPYFAMRDCLTLAIQTSRMRSVEQAKAVRQLQGAHYQELREYLEQYRATLPDEIYSDPRFSFRVYQIPKTGNHRNSSDLALEVVYENPDDPEALGDLNRRIAVIREKRVPVVNQGKLKVKGVVVQVAQRTGRRFNVSHHTNAWKLYGVRESGHSAAGCETKYCQYDEPHKDYVYTQDWVEFLVEKVSDDEEFQRIRTYRETEQQETS